jgi:pimeloyl-ACP methyl ester carboxylesterase
MRFGGLLFSMLLLFVGNANAGGKSDLAKEKRWEEQIVPSLMVGEDIKLKADGVEFLALYAEPTTEQSKGAVILIHGRGAHPAWPDVIEPLRMQLPDYGWHTLSLQMPVLKNEAEDKDYPPLFPEVPARVQAGVDFLKSKGIRNIVISGHSTGAVMASYYLATIKDPAVKVFAIVSGGFGVPKDTYMDSMENFKKLKNVDILDIYGSEDRKMVLKVVSKRKMVGPKLFGSRYHDIKIEGAGHFYRERTDQLLNQLKSWLDKDLAR